MIVLAKNIHLSCVFTTWLLFLIRGVWMVRDSPLLRKRWARLVPPVVDTLLLASAITLALSLRQYPIVHAWLTAKLIALLFYIGLGMIALTYGKNKKTRITAWIAAQMCFFYIVLVALTHNPAIFL